MTDGEEKLERAGGETAPEGEGEGPGEVSALPRFADLDGVVESLLFAAGAPLPLRRILEVLNGPTAKEVKAAVERLMAAYNSPGRGIRLLEVAGGYQLRSEPAYAVHVRALLRERPARLGRAALETLAIVAYRQPATRAEIEAVRGVDADAALSSLLSKQLVKIVGRKEAVGRPLMYATTVEFLEVFGLKDLSELPALKDIGPVAEPEDETVSDDDSYGRAAAEDHEPRGDKLAAGGGSDDPGGPGDGERAHGDGAGDAGGSAS